MRQAACEGHADTARIFHELASRLPARGLGSLEEALQHFIRALAVRCELLGERHPETPSTYYECGNVCIYIPGEVQESAGLQRGKRLRSGASSWAIATWRQATPATLLRTSYHNLGAPECVYSYYHLTHAADLEVHGATHEETIDAVQSVASFKAYFAADGDEQKTA